jgi:hypothetical protein
MTSPTTRPEHRFAFGLFAREVVGGVGVVEAFGEREAV